MNYCKKGAKYKASAMIICILLMTLCGCGGTDDSAKSSITVSGGDIPVIQIENAADVISIETEDMPEEEAAEEEAVFEYTEIYDEVAKEYSKDIAGRDTVSMAFVGDVGFAEGYATINTYRRCANGVADCIGPEVLAYMQGVDIMMANNEFPYSYRGAPTPNKTYTFRADPKDANIMCDMGVDIVSLANNHAYDYGPDALIDTVDTLNEVKLPFVGAGKNYEEASKPAYFHVADKVISYVSATQIERYANPDTREATEDSPGVMRTLDASKFVKEIEEAEANSDFVVVYVHWGSESTDLVEQSQRDLARAYVDAGADLIIGDHSHCLQGIDYVDNVPVFFSLGNFWFNSKTLDTCVVVVTLNLDMSIAEVKFVPCIQTGCKVRIANESEHSRIIDYMRGISNYAQIDDDGIVVKSDTNHNTQNGQNTSPARKPAEPAQPEVPSMEELLNTLAGQGAEAPPAADGEAAAAPEVAQ